MDLGSMETVCSLVPVRYPFCEVLSERERAFEFLGPTLIKFIVFYCCILPEFNPPSAVMANYLIRPSSVALICNARNLE